MAAHLHEGPEWELVGQSLSFEGDCDTTAVVLDDDFAVEFAEEVIGNDLPADVGISCDVDARESVAQRLQSGDRGCSGLRDFVEPGFCGGVAPGGEQDANADNRSHRAF